MIFGLDLTEACGEQPGVACRNVYDWTENATLSDLAEWLVDRPLRILLILIAAWILTRVARRLIRRSARRIVDSTRSGRLGRVSNTAVVGAAIPDPARAHARAEAVQSVLGSVVSTIIWAIAVLVALGELDIEIGPLIAGAGVAGVALGFGAQTLVRDFLAGLFIVIEDQFGVGDTVDLQDVSGTVEEVSLRSSKIRDVSGVLWTVSNGEIVKAGNATKGWSRSKIDVAVAYDSDVREAMAIALRIAEELREDETWVLDILEPPEMWGVEQLAVDGVTIRLVVKTRPGRQYEVTRELQLRIKEAFEAAGIEIPFPQRTLWVRRPEDAAALPTADPDD
ncbi:MAG TPA: mechanosensitive ion channel family protein [Acidimicrobiales bacterium]|nr:mechanosensitive ion channel family protein [Acidimicrobiales bacterium]